MKTLGLFLSMMSCLAFTASVNAGFKSEPPAWAYDAGPLLDSKDQKTREMADELVKLNANIPYFPGVSYDVTGAQKFRPAYGPISWRMLLQPNSVKVLFIGQDGTHIAEAAGRPATAGFGGRAHDLANHFGVDYSAAFINTYAFTIRGQYGDRGVPYLKNGRLNFTSQYLDNELWQMSQGQDSPIVQWRNSLIDWIIRNNQKSLKLIVTFGGSARDSVSSFIESKANGEVGSKLSRSALAGIRMPEFKSEYAGGNNSFPVPINRFGKDIYKEMLGKLDYKKPSDQTKAQSALRDQIATIQNEMVFSRGGIDQSGLLHPAQLGGYDIGKIKVNGERTISLKGLKLSNGDTIENNVLVVDLPHPTYLSNVNREPGGDSKVKTLVNRKTDDLEWWRDNRSWSIEPDHGFEEANFFRKVSYEYGRGDIGQEYYDFGTPANRMVPVSSAKRIDAETILLGARSDNVLRKGNKDIAELKDSRAAEAVDSTEMFISISRTEKSRDKFDPGPGAELARIMKTTIDLREVHNQELTIGHEGRTDSGQMRKLRFSNWIADFGHYRGRPDAAKVVVLADPQGWDDVITSRALTGTRGQHLQGLIANGISKDDWSESHFVLKTVPFGMDGAPGEAGATSQQWSELLKLTADYREQVLKFVMDASDVELILTDGQHAKAAMAKFLADNPSYKGKAAVVNIDRTDNNSQDMVTAQSKISDAGIQVTESGYRGRRANIPNSHLSYYARVWEGTSKDRVITSSWNPGVSFAQVVPTWVVKQRPKMTDETEEGIQKLVESMYNSCLPNPGEKPADFLRRKAKGEMPKDCNI